MDGSEVPKVGIDDPMVVKTPEDLYELIGVTPDADEAELKKAYYDKMKVCHPDIAGEEGEEMCMILNESYDLLSNPQTRAEYDEQVSREKGYSIRKYAPVASTDLKPTWEWTAKKHWREGGPQYTGVPFSRSLHERVPPESRGRKWDEAKFAYVDEWSCIACRNCCDVAPKTFCIDMDAGRARVYSQWGNSEEDLDYAVQACPVDCIYWVSREELQVLEYVTREKLWENGNQLPCPMAARQGNATGRVKMEDPFKMASSFMERMKDEQRTRAKGMGGFFSGELEKVRSRISEAFGKLGSTLKLRGWGGWKP